MWVANTPANVHLIRIGAGKDVVSSLRLYDGQDCRVAAEVTIRDGLYHGRVTTVLLGRGKPWETVASGEDLDAVQTATGDIAQTMFNSIVG